MKVQIRSLSQWFTLGEYFTISFTNELEARVKDKDVARQIIDLVCFDREANEKTFEIKFSQDGLDVILDNITLVE
jgi:hypothetical protein